MRSSTSRQNTSCCAPPRRSDLICGPMARFSIALEPIAEPALTPEMLGRLAVVTRQSANKWKERLVAPHFGRLAMDFDTEKQARDWADKLTDAGLRAHAVSVKEI